MIKIKKADFEKLRKQHPDYISRCGREHNHNGKVCKIGEWMAFESCLTGDYSKGTTLIFEHIHFEII